jgi:hypothetical protein
MKPLRAKMLRYMERRGYSALTVKSYISWVSQFAQHYGKLTKGSVWLEKQGRNG